MNNRLSHHRIVCLSVALACAGIASGHAVATDYFIADGDVAGLIAAITDANADPNRSATIHLAANGNYTLGNVDNLDFGFGPNGLPTIISTITINGNGATIERSSDPATPDFRILLVIGPVAGVDGVLTLNDATITGGQTSNGGGGIAHSGTVTVVNSTISNNFSGLNGGGIANAFGGILTVIDSSITGNWANNNGGGIRNFADAGSATIIDSTITGNGTSGNGGGIDNLAPMTVTGTTITDNSAGSFGGGVASTAALMLTGSTIGENTALFGDGGGLWSNTFATEIGDTSFCDNDPNHTSGTYSDLGGNEFSNDCPSCPADFDNNGVVNVFDLLELLAAWGPCPTPPAPCPADLDDNSVVNVFDLLELLAAWGPCP